MVLFRFFLSFFFDFFEGIAQASSSVVTAGVSSTEWLMSGSLAFGSTAWTTGAPGSTTGSGAGSTSWLSSAVGMRSSNSISDRERSGSGIDAGSISPVCSPEASSSDCLLFKISSTMPGVAVCSSSTLCVISVMEVGSSLTCNSAARLDSLACMSSSGSGMRDSWPDLGPVEFSVVGCPTVSGSGSTINAPSTGSNTSIS